MGATIGHIRDKANAESDRITATIERVCASWDAYRDAMHTCQIADHHPAAKSCPGYGKDGCECFEFDLGWQTSSM